MRALVLRAGAEQYTVPLDTVREVVADPKVGRVPGAHPAVIGVMNLRGDVVPVLDTGLLLGRARLPEAPFAAVVQTKRGPAALIAGDEPQTVTIERTIEAEDGRIRHALGEGLAAPVDVDALLGQLAGTPR